MGKPRTKRTPRPRRARASWFNGLLTETRRDLGLTQEAAAAILGVSRNSYKAWETTDAGPSDPRMRRRLLLFAAGLMDLDGEVTVEAAAD